jgi:hypothetical protein
VVEACVTPLPRPVMCAWLILEAAAVAWPHQDGTVVLC